MTENFKALMYVLKYPVFGKEAAGEISCDLNKLLAAAVAQGVFPLVYAGLTRDGKALSPKWENMFVTAIIQHEQKMSFLSDMANEFEKNDIDCCVLKGCTIAALYNMPDCRMSGDIDILIPPEKEKQAMALLEKLGLHIKERPDGSQHFKAENDLIGLVEVHIRPYSKNFDDIVLRNRFSIGEEYIPIKINDMLTVKKLGVTDDLYFLTAHLIKHFIREGCGIRQVTDLLVYIDKNRNALDLDKYFAVMRELGFEKLIKNVLGIGVTYFDMQFDIYETDLIDNILSDIETGGAFGFGEAERKGFYEKFLSLRTSRSSEEFEEMMNARKKRSKLKVLFLPSRRYLVNKGYKYLEKAVLLYPIAYIQRLCSVAVKTIKGERSVKKDLKFS
ncbi:MAG: nucleotidyltransferase family protein, partial [Clostridia bacterium]|nr:nucleotidyltransferase family protein [Clostridia bacterium]